MNEVTVPPIPQWLDHRPTVGGLVVPWITPHTREGKYLFGSVESTLAEHTLRDRRCGVCGRSLQDRLILFLRLSDLSRQRTNEPAVDPSCAHYTTRACPMINGRLRTYRSSPLQLGGDVVCGNENRADSSARLGAPAEPWFAVWLRDYRLVRDQGHLTASYAGSTPLRIRPVNWRFPELG